MNLHQLTVTEQKEKQPNALVDYELVPEIKTLPKIKKKVRKLRRVAIRRDHEKKKWAEVGHGGKFKNHANCIVLKDVKFTVKTIEKTESVYAGCGQYDKNTTYTHIGNAIGDRMRIKDFPQNGMRCPIKYQGGKGGGFVDHNHAMVTTADYLILYPDGKASAINPRK